MKYVGETKNGKYHGQGTKTWSEGTKYVGEFKDGKRHRQGTVTWTDGFKYVGEWKNHSKWEGTQYDKDGKVTSTYSEGIEKPVN